MTRHKLAFASALIALAGMRIAVAAPPVPAGPPHGIHLSIVGDARTSMTVAWATSGTVDPAATVEWGPTAALGNTIDATTTPVLKLKVLAHEATIGGLDPDTEYHYRVNGTSGASPITTFRTAPATPKPFRFMIFGDQGTSPQARVTVDAVQAEDPDLVLLAGDGPYAEDDEREKWDTWFDINEPFASRVPFMPAPGNHEYEDGFYDWTTWRQRLALPNEEIWYGFDYNNVHFLILQSYVQANNMDSVQDDMALFAETDLAAAADRRAKGLIDHIVIVQHFPLYGDQEDVPQSERRMNKQLIALEEQWIHRYDIDILVAAHNHHYERLRPIMYGVPTSLDLDAHEDPAGFVEIITGGGGQGLYPLDQVASTTYAGVMAKRHHVTSFDVDGKTIRMRAIATDANPGVFDTWTLTRTR